MSLTIVMYRYVRDLPNTRYPKINAMSPRDFKGQLDYICKHYTVCTLDQVIAASLNGSRLPAKSCLLTFDDGLIDHYTTVFPRLISRGLPAVFFPAAKPVLEHVVLDTHKIHFILASTQDPKTLPTQILELLKPHRESFPDIPADEALLKKFAVPARFDSPETLFVKRVLQKALPDAVRLAIIEELYNRHVNIPETTLAHELYMDIPQLKTMAKQGMAVGGHGYSHLWLDSLDENAQAYEIRKSQEMLSLVHNHPPKHWALCYPYGGANDATLKLLQSKGCVLAFNAQLGLAPDLSNPLALPRLDANDLPTLGAAPINEWTQKA